MTHFTFKEIYDLVEIFWLTLNNPKALRPFIWRYHWNGQDVLVNLVSALVKGRRLNTVQASIFSLDLTSGLLYNEKQHDVDWNVRSVINMDIKQQQRDAVTLPCRKGTLWLFSLHTYWASKCTWPAPIFLTETAGIITSLWTFESSGLKYCAELKYNLKVELDRSLYVKKKCIDQNSIIQYFWLIKRTPRTKVD